MLLCYAYSRKFKTEVGLHCYRYDFFIVSQFVNQGTVSPTSYNIIHDTLGLDPDKIQRLTYKLTHMYYNWSVSRGWLLNNLSANCQKCIY